MRFGFTSFSSSRDNAADSDDATGSLWVNNLAGCEKNFNCLAA